MFFPVLEFEFCKNSVAPLFRFPYCMTSTKNYKILISNVKDEIFKSGSPPFTINQSGIISLKFLKLSGCLELINIAEK